MIQMIFFDSELTIVGKLLFNTKDRTRALNILVERMYNNPRICEMIKDATGFQMRFFR